MLDAAYFNEDFHRQASALGTPTVELHLRNGEVFRIKRVEEVNERYVLFSICPREIESGNKHEIAAAMKCRKSSSGETRFDRIAIPYIEIAYLIMSSAEVELDSPFGFTAQRFDR